VNAVGWRLRINVEPNIIVPVCVRVPQHHVNIVQRHGVADVEFNFRPEAAAPFLSGYTHIFFEHIYVNARVDARQHRNCQQ
jgi:hypothetical protein